ncbi:hypothetical protein UFOVP435_29 [uncultured Caudovirales phage]|uniref:Uncharacterized protein n=1 Tax=uncultured Caudovirales phage TaxID=2100421 RepID=A0A6J5M733_9CAUD|nr:hypothetical protein UFOVP435_29 [uncultured Caudovirales phage]
MTESIPPRLQGLTRAELSAMGDADVLARAIEAELSEYSSRITRDVHNLYTDDDVHAIVEERLAELPEDSPARTAIQRTYEMMLVIIDGGIADRRSDHELLHWVAKFRPVME